MKEAGHIHFQKSVFEISDEPKYHVVMRFCHLAEDYVVAGVFTVKNDAEIMVLDLKAKGHKSVARIEMTMNAVKEYLVSERYGKIGDTLQRMEKILDEIKAA